MGQTFHNGHPFLPSNNYLRAQMVHLTASKSIELAEFKIQPSSRGWAAFSPIFKQNGGSACADLLGLGHCLLSGQLCHLQRQNWQTKLPQLVEIRKDNSRVCSFLQVFRTAPERLFVHDWALPPLFYLAPGCIGLLPLLLVESGNAGFLFELHVVRGCQVPKRPVLQKIRPPN